MAPQAREGCWPRPCIPLPGSLRRRWVSWGGHQGRRRRVRYRKPRSSAHQQARHGCADLDNSPWELRCLGSHGIVHFWRGVCLMGSLLALALGRAALLPCALNHTGPLPPTHTSSQRDCRATACSWRRSSPHDACTQMVPVPPPLHIITRHYEPTHQAHTSCLRTLRCRHGAKKLSPAHAGRQAFICAPAIKGHPKYSKSCSNLRMHNCSVPEKTDYSPATAIHTWKKSKVWGIRGHAF